MFSKHVNKELSAYCHGELSAEEGRRVAEHLIGCNRCRPQFEEIKFGIKLAEQLPHVAAPDSLWSDLEVRLDEQSRYGATSMSAPRGRRYRSLLLQPRLVALAALVVLALGLGAVWLYKREARPFWDVANLKGTPRIGARGMGETGKLGLGQWLETDSASRAQIEVSGIGQVEIDPNTSVRLVETKPTEHRLELARGKMSARIWAPPKLFYVDTPSGVAEDLGCAYTLEVDDHGASLLRVTLGWVALQLKDRESMVPAGAACATRRGIGPGTPYFEDASESFRAALTKLDFEPGRKDQEQILESLLTESRTRDTLTLWHLLARVEGEDRVRVYDRMVELGPPPPGVTRAGALALDQKMLDLWKDKLETSWGDYSFPAMKALKKAWTTGLGKVRGLEGKR
jgi:anti-sigma factor RsiW